MNSDVETEELNKGRVLAKAEESGQVGRVVLVEVDGRELALTEDVSVNSAGNVGEFGDPGPVSSNVSSCRMRRYTHKSMQSSKTGPQYSFLLIPCW